MIFQDHIVAAAAAAATAAAEAGNHLQKDYLKNITTLEEIVNAASASTIKVKKQTACRVMSLCLNDGQRIRHKRSLPTAWIATYKKATNTILYKETNYSSLGQFAQAHYKVEKPSRTTVSGWLECECESATEPEKWISTENLPVLKN